jgi:hypothetical protein
MSNVVISLYMQASQDSHGHDANTGRKAAVSGLAIVGFVALIVIGIATAIYAASFIPKALSRLGSANVYLGAQDGATQTDGIIPVNPREEAPTAVSYGTTTTTAPVSSAAPVSTYAPAAAPKPVPAPVYYPTYTQPTYQQVAVPQYYGRPDLVATILSVGYLRRDGDTNSYIADDTVPSGRQGAVRFSVANRGGEPTGTWNFSARLPSDSDSNYRSGTQRSLNPGDSIIFTLGFDSSDHGRNTIRVTADSNDRVSESNESNNEDTETIYLDGSSSSSSSDRDYDSDGKYCRYGTYYQNGRYRCETSSSATNDSRDYDSNGSYCRYGTYYQNGRYYCDSQNSSNDSGVYDSFGNYCRSGSRVYQNGIYTCDSTTSYGSDSYDSNGNYCRYGTYYSNNRYYCS